MLADGNGEIEIRIEIKPKAYGSADQIESSGNETDEHEENRKLKRRRLELSTRENE